MEKIIIEIIKVVGAILTPALSAYVVYKLNNMHKQYNSRMDELLKAQKKIGNAEGRAEQKQEEIDNQKLG
jgi:hypothetical protein